MKGCNVEKWPNKTRNCDRRKWNAAFTLFQFEAEYSNR